MPSQAHGWAAYSAKDPLKPYTFERRDPRPNDVVIQIAYCGICHSDLHTVREQWGNITFPMVPGHEIVGHVKSVGDAVTKFAVGDSVGVGCMVDSCRHCAECKSGLEQFCADTVYTYSSDVPDSPTKQKVTLGGYSDHIVVREEFVLRIPSNLNLAAAAPLLCAGITTYSPLRHWKAEAPGKRVGVVGIGGLGHMAVKLARAMGAEVTVFTTSEGKKSDALKLGAHHVILSKKADQMQAAFSTLDLIIDTAGITHDLTPYMSTLRRDGAHVLVGLPEEPNPPISPFVFIRGRHSLAGSNIGGIAETQEMLDFCGKHNITADIELIKFDYVNEAYERMLKNDVKFRFVIDVSSIAK